MKLAIIGYGKMGKLIEEIALQKEQHVVAKIDPKLPTNELTEQSLKDAEVCIDFSHPTIILENIHKMAAMGKNLVVGTTGWYDQIDTVKQIVNRYKIGFLYSPNFSIGVNLYMKIIKEAAMLINSFDEYDVGGFEVHHNQKVDSPSGTARAIAGALLDYSDRKKTVTYDMVNRNISPEELHFASLRCGSNPGTHTVVFDSPADAITITHQARNREGFARGAIAAAEWLQGKKGFFTMNDVIESMR